MKLSLKIILALAVCVATTVLADYVIKVMGTTMGVTGGAIDSVPLVKTNIQVRVTFTGYSRSETLTNFPALVTIPASFLKFYYGFTSPDGYELRFYDQTGTNELSYEVEQWNRYSTSYIWVCVPTLTNGSYITATIGAVSLSSNQAAYCTNGTVWANGFAGVYHFKNTTDFTDSTSNRFHGVNTNSTTATGLVGGGRDFDNTNTNVPNRQRIAIPTTFGLDGSNFTLACWAKIDSSSEYGSFIKVGATNNGIALGVGLTDMYTPEVGARSLGRFDGLSTRFAARLGGPDCPFSPNAWAWFAIESFKNGATNSALVFNGNRYYYKRNDPWFPPAGEFSYIGGHEGIDGTTRRYMYTDATIDEVRISSVSRSTNWLWAEFMNMGSNGLFQTYSEITL